MQNFGIGEWLIILMIVLVIFGASRLRELGSGLGGAIREFRKAVSSENDRDEAEGKATKEEESSEG